MRRLAQTLFVGSAFAAVVFLAAALIAAPNTFRPGNVHDAWNCFWAFGACGVLAAMCAFWSVEA